MDWAKEPGTGRLVRAAAASRGRYYRCPVCKADVFPRFPRPSNSRRYRQYRTPHFAHRPGQGSEKCELYHPADAIQHPRPSFPGATDGLARHETGIPPLSLSIELEQEALIRGNRLREWGLRLTVPKSDDPHGRLSIDLGGNDVRTVALSKLPCRRLRIRSILRQPILAWYGSARKCGPASVRRSKDASRDLIANVSTCLLRVPTTLLGVALDARR